MGKIGVGMASDHIMDALMLFYTHSSALAVSLDCIWISQRKVLLWRMSTRLVPYVRLSGTEEEEIGLFIFLYFSWISNHYPRNTSNTIVFLTLWEIYVFLCVTTTATSYRYGQESLIPYFMASVFSNSLWLTRTSKLRVLDWITYTIIKQRLGPTSTKDWLIAYMSVKVEQKLLENG